MLGMTAGGGGAWRNDHIRIGIIDMLAILLFYLMP